MPLAEIDTGGVARCLDQIAEQDDDYADVFFERVSTLGYRPGAENAALSTRYEEGLAVRLVRGDQAWLASRDAIDGESLRSALSQVARSSPLASRQVPELTLEPWVVESHAEVLDFPKRVRDAIRDRHAAFDAQIEVQRWHRQVRVVGSRVAPDPEKERYYSCRAATPHGSWGALFTELDRETAGKVADALVGLFRAREAPPPQAGRRSVVFAPEAATVFLHEVVAHALEADTLRLTGDPMASIGLRLAGADVHVVDDPSGAPPAVKRATDDEGAPVQRRWLLRRGVVEQPIAERRVGQDSAALLPGCGRRSDRHAHPSPRSTHLELLAGESSTRELLDGADGGLYVPEISRGQLDPLTGWARLWVPWAQHIDGGELGHPTGPCCLAGRVESWLRSVVAMGSTSQVAGAGWCAKGGVRLPVWGRSPHLLLQDVEIGS